MNETKSNRAQEEQRWEKNIHAAYFADILFVGGEEIVRVVVGGGDERAHLAVDQLRRLFRVGLLEHLLARLRHVEADVAHLGVHAVVDDLGVGALRHLLQVVLRSGRDLFEEYLLRHPAAQRHAHAVEQLLFGVQILLFGQVLGVAETLAAGDDRYLREPSRNKIIKSIDF